MDKIVRRLTVRRVSAQPGHTVLVHASQSDPVDDTWGGYTFVTREEDQPRVGQRLKITIEDDS